MRHGVPDGLVMRYLAGECAPGEVERACARDAGLQARLAALDALAKRLDSAALEQRETLREVARTRFDPRFDTGDAQLPVALPPRVRRTARWAGALLACAAALALWSRLPAGRAPAEVALDAEAVVLHAPEWDGPAGRTFRFELLVDRATLPPLRMRVFAGDVPLGRPLAVSPPLEGTTWTCTESELSGCGDSICAQLFTQEVGEPPRVLATWPR